jgi:hypothetical protein
LNQTALDNLEQSLVGATISTFDPYSLEGHYGLDMACYLLHQQQPRSVRIIACDAEVVKAAARRLDWVSEPLLVETPQLASVLIEQLGVRSVCEAELPADAALVLLPAGLSGLPPMASFIVTVAQNALSYKSLLHPGQVGSNVFALLRWLKQRYIVCEQVGLFGPRFVFNWALSQLAGVRWAPEHFRFGQRAIDNLYSSGSLWWLGYLVVVAARQKA